MKFVPKAITRAVAKNQLLLNQHSPRLLFIAGTVGMVGTVVLSSRATLKIEGVLEDAEIETNLLVAQGQEAVDDENRNYTAKDLKQDILKLKVHHAQRLIKLYMPAIVLGGLSIAALTKSHSMLTKRNASLTLAYAAATEALNEYRDRVRQSVGDEREKEIYYGMKDHVIVEDTDKGPKKVNTKVATEPGLYARFYDEYAKNWQPDPELNRIFITNQQRYLNDRLHAKGHVFLNEAYDALGLERSEAGQHVGWTLDGEGDGYIDFSMYDGRNSEAFINGYEASILLDFNVDGPITKKAFNR